MSGSGFWKSLVAVLLASFSLSVGIPAGAAGPPPCQTNCATSLALTGANTGQPFGITSGPRGSVWFSFGDSVGRIDQQDQVTTYFVRSNARTGWMTADPSDESVWFAERGTGKVGRIMPNGAITEFSLPTSTALPQGIVFAPDGNIYVTEQGANAIARLNPTAGQAVDIPVPTPNSTTQSGALGPDGAIWFIERSAAKVGRMTLDGHFTEYPLAAGAFPNRIVVGPDGALWFTELNAGELGRITTNGLLTEFPVAGGPVGITVGKDGQLYVDLFTVPGVDRIDVEGQVTGHWDLPGAGGPLQLTTGFGLDIWDADAFGGQLFQVTPYVLGR